MKRRGFVVSALMLSFVVIAGCAKEQKVRVVRPAEEVYTEVLPIVQNAESGRTENLLVSLAKIALPGFEGGQISVLDADGGRNALPF